MKLPRWLVIAMLTTSMLSVLAAAGWWWVTWPERTAREFVGLMDDATELEFSDWLDTAEEKQAIRTGEASGWERRCSKTDAINTRHRGTPSLVHSG
jgi:hypothetical protein